LRYIYGPMASPILRETIKKLKERRALLQKQVKGPLEELRQIEEDLLALGAAPKGGRRPPASKRPASRPADRQAPRKPAGANQAAILRAVRNGATEPEAVAEKTGIAPATVKTAVTTAVTKQKLLTRGPNGLTLTRAGRDRLIALEAAAQDD
jgi:DNA-binding NarL/FixJ family response regulator